MMYCLVKRYIIIWIMFSSIPLKCGMLYCDSIEEGSPAILQIPTNVSTINSNIDIYKNYRRECICFSNIRQCDVIQNSSLTCNWDNVMNKITVTEKNITRSTNKNSTECWNVRYSPEKIYQECCFQIFSKAENLTCVSRSEESVNVSCTATNIFPEASCLFAISRNTDQVVNTIIYASNSKYWPTNSSEDLFYYKATCEFYRDITSKTVGSYIVQVSMYPNINNETSSDKIYGVNKTLKIKFEGPSIEFPNCVDNVEEDVIANCSCKMKGLGSESATYSWLNTSGHVVLSNTSLLTYEATEYNTAFLCIARSEKFNVTISKVYNVTLITTNSTTSSTTASSGTFVSIVITIVAIITIFSITVLVFRFGRSKVTHVSMSRTKNAATVPLKIQSDEQTYSRISDTETGHYHTIERLSTSTIASTMDGIAQTCARFQLQSLALDIKSVSFQSSTKVSASQGDYSDAKVHEDVNDYETIT
ncbi:polymorphic transmembrane cluster 2 transmembrane protein 2 [Biomphalaria pfeifferi]|uniref:Polymorphic transmembrane cluster 2 transmembrane protein 2 n=1 Tax=Biomphalaria pfeifferi TaxID=112525 RepID=A0AAD8C7A3_BIOPF|nr:polymorphic transmembrane cluster 2 transmembrane protein 2 [Biomphalaria pfeifferi]